MSIAEILSATPLGHPLTGSEDLSVHLSLESMPLETMAITSQRNQIPVEVAISQIKGTSPPLWVVTLQDTSEIRKGEVRTEQITRISSLLLDSLDHREMGEFLGKFAATELCDWSIIHTLENGMIHATVGFTRVPQNQAKIDRIVKSRSSLGVRQFLGGVLSSRKSVLLRDVTDNQMSKLFGSVEAVRRIKELGMRSFVSIPLRLSSDTFGSWTLVRTEDSFSDIDTKFFEEISLRAAIAMKNAHLYSTAKEAIKSREDVLATVSHDLINPLSAIGLGVEMLDNLFSQPDLDLATIQKRAAKCLASISRSANAALKLTSGIMNLAKLDNQTNGLEAELGDPTLMLSNAIDVLRPIAEDKQIEIKLDVISSCAVFHDPTKLSQVIANLIGNAIRYTPPAGKITVEVEVIDPYLKIRVIDSGCGIKAADLPHIFDRYWQAEGQLSGSLGLGLSIVRSIIESHGGCIHAKSIEGAGATFSFELPLNPPSALMKSNAHSSPHPLSPSSRDGTITLEEPNRVP